MPGRGVTLEEDLVAEAAVGLAAEEVVEADLVERGRRRVRREVTAETVEAMVRAVDHRHRVPADERADAPLDVLVAGEPRLLLGRDRVDVVGGDHRRDADALLARALHEPREQVAGTGTAPAVDDRVERVEPLRRLGRVDVGELVDEAVDEHRVLRSTPPPTRLRPDLADFARPVAHEASSESELTETGDTPERARGASVRRDRGRGPHPGRHEREAASELPRR